MASEHGEEAAPAPAKSRKKLLIAVPIVVLALAGAGGWFSGIIPKMLGKKPAESTAAANHDGPNTTAMAATAAKVPPTFVDVPEILTNLNVAGKRPSYVKLHAKLELAAKSDEAGVVAAMPRIQDLFQTYLRDMRPDELRGSEGSYRLREELIGRADVAVAPAQVSDVLFIEMVIQ